MMKQVIPVPADRETGTFINSKMKTGIPESSDAITRKGITSDRIFIRNTASPVVFEMEKDICFSVEVQSHYYTVAQQSEISDIFFQETLTALGQIVV